VIEGSLKLLTPSRLRAYPAICVLVMVVAVVLYTIRDPTFLGADFRAFYTAGTFLRTGRSDLLYDIDAATHFQAESLGAAGVSAWLSPPYLAWLFVPLSRMPFLGALAFHTLLGLAAAFAAVALLEREVGPFRRSEALLVVAGYYPTLQWLADGQMTAFWMLAIAAFFALIRRGRDGAAGAALGFLALKPQLAVGFVAALVGARRFRALFAAAATASAWLAIGFLTLPNAMRDYVAKASEIGAFLRSEGYPLAGLHGIFQLGPLLLDGFSPAAATATGAVLTAAALAALVAMWARAPWNPGDTSWDRRMAATIALATLASPHLFGYDLMLLLVALIIVWRLYPDGTRRPAQSGRSPERRPAQSGRSLERRPAQSGRSLDRRPLDGGPILAVTALLWALALVGPALTVGQQTLSRWVFGRAVALQVEIPVMLAWVWFVLRPALATDQRSARAW
jgi:hypothetical protein